MITQEKTAPKGNALLPLRNRTARVPLSEKHVWVALIVVTASVLAALNGDLDLIAALCWALVFGITGFFWLTLAANDAASSWFMPRLFAGAFLLRVFGAVFIHNFLRAQVNYDASGYELFGLMFSDYWHHLSPCPPLDPLGGIYSQIVGVQYFLTENNPYIPQLINGVAGSLVPVVVYDVGRRHFGGEQAGRVSGLCATFLTAWVIWSSITMRDIYVILCIALVMREAIDMQVRITLARSLRLLVWLTAIWVYRPYADMILAIALSITFTFTLARKPLARIVLGFVLFCVLGVVLAVGGVRAVVAQIIENQTQALEMTRSVVVYKAAGSFGTDVHYHSLGDVVKFLPVGLFYFLGGPFPWTFGGRQFFMTIPEWSTWYFIFYFGARGYLHVSKRSTKSLPLVTFFIVGSVMLTLVSGDFAISIRHRSMLSVALVMLAGTGWVNRKERFFAGTSPS